VDTVGPLKDHNCNGIFGVDSTGRSYEQLFCSQSSQRGVIILGDSATAHFRIPPEWLEPKIYSNRTFQDLLAVLTDEADWPQCSWGTGYENDTSCPPSPLLHVDSMALRMRNRNLCNHRDFQNIGVNGASTNSLVPSGSILVSMHNRTYDQPALVVYALVGNDVCSHHHDFDHMTTPAQFEKNVLATLAYLDLVLVKGSHVAFLGIIDGRILYNVLNGLIHPLGVPYSDFYDYLNCFDTSPCWGWMNSNSTVRDLTWAHVVALNAVYSKIINEQKYKNFDLSYFPPNEDEMIAKWKALGGDPKDLIEPVDGFHPSQSANEIIAEMMWEFMEANFTQALGPVNPLNAQIISVFGANLNGY